jgi:hypothetical protein
MGQEDEIPDGFFIMPIKQIFDPRFGRWMKPDEHTRAVEALRAKGEKKVLPTVGTRIPPARRGK